MSDLLTPTAEALLVCVGPRPHSANVINAVGKLAVGRRAKWFAVYVETPKMLMLPGAERDRAIANLRLAQQLGAETVTLTGRNIAEEIVTFARQRNVTKIVAGKPETPRWRGILTGSPVDQLVRTSGDIDVYVMTGDTGAVREATPVIRPNGNNLADYGTGLMWFTVATLLSFSMYPYLHLTNLVMVYLLGVMLTATSCGRGPAVLVSVVSVLAFDFFFVPPRFSFSVEEAQYIVTFGVMLLVALIISHLATMLRQQAAIARAQERQAVAMHGLSRQLASSRGMEQILQVAVKYISEIFDGQTVVLLPDEQGKLSVAAGDLSGVLQKDVVKEMQAARSAYESGRTTGLGTTPSPTGRVAYVPLRAADSTLGVLALRPADPHGTLVPEQADLLESLTSQVALALEVEQVVGNRAAATVGRRG